MSAPHPGSASRATAAMNPLESWHEEQRSAYLYRVCGEAESDGTRAELFRRLAGEAEAQAAIWRAQVTARGHAPPAPFEPDGRTRLVATLVKYLGPRRMRGVLAAMKVRGMSIYGSAMPRDAGHAPPSPSSRHRAAAPRPGRRGQLACGGLRRE